MNRKYWLTLHTKVIIKKYSKASAQRFVQIPVLLLIFSSLFTSCVSYKVESKKNSNEWVVYRNEYLIPEYTISSEGNFPSSELIAQRTFEERKDTVEKILKRKYEGFDPKQNKFLLLLPLMPISDIVFTISVGGANLFRKMMHREPYDFVWFPATRWVLYGSPLTLPETTPQIREEWNQDINAQKQLGKIIQDEASPI